ncbi:MAG: GNAT family N-acetyltransferase [Bernardetiaceae bacterium]|nr:GNAT family N-acetyltransferase [Bernardetiaceae bacterium]
MLNIKNVACDSEDYKKLLALRRKMIADVIGRPLKDSETADDAKCRHIVALRREDVVGGLLLFTEEDHYRITQMVIEEKWQSRGLGNDLLEFTEMVVRNDKARDTLVAHAPDFAVKFYQNRGYTLEGAEFKELDYKHFKMKKSIE